MGDQSLIFINVNTCHFDNKFFFLVSHNRRSAVAELTPCSGWPMKTILKVTLRANRMVEGVFCEEQQRGLLMNAKRPASTPSFPVWRVLSHAACIRWSYAEGRRPYFDVIDHTGVLCIHNTLPPSCLVLPSINDDFWHTELRILNFGVGSSWKTLRFCCVAARPVHNTHFLLQKYTIGYPPSLGSLVGHCIMSCLTLKTRPPSHRRRSIFYEGSMFMYSKRSSGRTNGHRDDDAAFS